MKGKTLFLTLLMIASGLCLKAQKTVTISGTVTDFNSKPIDSVTVCVKDKSFKDLFTTISDKDGKYSLKVTKGRYTCLYAINLKHYGKSKLEYWAWNIPAFNDLEINPQYDRMEVYALNVFEPQVEPYDTYMLYFRPMSLTKALGLQSGDYNKKKFEQDAGARHDTINIAPKNITPEELTVRINDQNVKVVQVHKIIELAKGINMYGYMIQVLKNKDEVKPTDIDKVTVILHSNETNETGRADCFYEKVKYLNGENKKP